MLRRSHCALAVAALVWSLCLPAFAQSAGEPPVSPAPAPAPAPPPAPPAAPETVWYGWQVLLSDAAAVGLSVGAARGSTPMTWGALGVYAFGAPMVHLGHDQAGAAGRSLAFRLGLPVAGFALFYAGAKLSPESSCKGNCEEDDSLRDVSLGFVGASAGVLAAVIADASLASKPVAPSPAGLRLTPSFAVARGGAVLGAFGSF